jgi:crotonobetainyl-CoA:carnitine CoA-transferase CaiB-like acyl-CoA transferase
MERAMRPLEHVHVLDLSRVLAGPYCAALLADAGAEVVKVERPGDGDESRKYGELLDGVGLDFLNVNRGKRGMTLDLKSPAGAEALRRLSLKADVIIENFVPGTMERFGLGYERLATENPRLIYCSISAYGLSGELAQKPGYDGALQAFTGHMVLTGESDGRPVRSGASVVDMATGLAAYGAIVTALLHRETTGVGQLVTLSLLHTALSIMGTHGSVVLNSAKDPARAGSGVSHLAPYRAYRTADADIVVGALNDESWRRLCVVLDLAGLLSDERFESMQSRVANRASLDVILEGRLRSASSEHWIERLSGTGLVVSKVNTLREALSHQQVAANELIADVGSGKSALRYVRSPMRFGGFDNRSRRPPPQHGEHGHEILTEAGFSASDAEELLQSGAHRGRRPVGE